MEKLAVECRRPVNSSKIFYAQQWFDECKKCFTDYIRVKYAAAVRNITAKLHCACFAAGIKSGDENIPAPLTFAHSVNCALYCGGLPVFADVNHERIRENITDKTKNVVAVENDEIWGILLTHTGFSLHLVMTVTGGEGAAVIRNNESSCKNLILARSHGFTYNESMLKEPPHEGSWYYEQFQLGRNYRLTDFLSLLLINQMKKLERVSARLKEIVRRYDEAFSGISGIILETTVHIIRLNLDMLRFSRYICRRCPLPTS